MQKINKTERIIVPCILTLLSLISVYFLIETFAAHQELLRQVAANKEALLESQRLLQEKVNSLHSELPNTNTVSTAPNFYGITWSHVGMGLVIGIVVAAVIVGGNHYFFPPSGPDISTLGDIKDDLIIIDDKIVNLATKHEDLDLERVKTISLIEDRELFLSNLASQQTENIGTINNSCLALYMEGKDQDNTLSQISSKIKVFNDFFNQQQN
jgi:hypothetical protein